MISKVIHAQLFLEGVQVPFESMTLTMAPGRMNLLQVELTPVAGFYNIFPRTIVQAFYNDGKTWRNFFEGEVIGHAYSKTSGQRAMVLTCGDLSNYWRYSYAFFINFVDQMSLSLASKVQFFTGLDPTSVNDPTQSATFAPIRDTATAAVQVVSGSQSQDIVAGFVKIFQSIANVNSFYSSRMGSLRVNDRIVSLPDGQIKTLMDPTAFDILKYLLDMQDDLTPVMSVLSTMLQVLYQNFWSLSLPSLSTATGNPVNFLLLPATFMTSPPRCNVIFPDIIESIQYSRHFMDEPTRFWLMTGSAQGGEFQNFFAPGSFRSILPQLQAAQQQNKILRQQNLLVSSSNPELDETLLGILPEKESLQLDVFASVRRAFIQKQPNTPAGNKAAEDTINLILQQVSDFEFLLRKFSRRSVPVSTTFNPNIHPAFPVVILDAYGNLFGSPLQVTHTINAKGSARTQIDCGFARDNDVLGDIIQTPPPWMNKAYDPKGIGSKTFSFTNPDGTSGSVPGAYTQLIDPKMTSILTNSIPTLGSGGTTSLVQPVTQQQAAQLLFQLWQNTGDKGAFVREYTHRPIQTMAQALEFLGLTQVNSELLSGAMYDPRKQAVIQTVKTQLVESGNAVAEV